MLYQWDLGKDSPENVERLFWSNTGWIEDDSMRAFAGRLFQGTTRVVRELDSVIRGHTENWRMERMAAVDRNILRLGAYELLHEKETPPAVVINEALEIARRYSGEESVQFINGLLDTIRKQMEATQTA
jgi:transcription antitermination protein NusB